ncbi:hypothetical protein JoomaDRAFT_3054 [Galbibacter orientalis DSM 19592]|uniref:CARDB domain-containing protein n=1 Tax=Galbibacter orientalis DSM 19592 TaxID=926559 RepID=I3C8R4_9FLAO|nr:hypothetical protein [Galbibacter orientalis]EIJ40007.1 hypothetical protein JoomaDRAFT_3054 [Galbibacter orientalis DSM 19592]
MKTKITSILPIFLVLLLIYNNLYSQIGFPIRQQVIYDGYTSDYDVYHLTIENKECSTCYEYNFDIRNEFNKKYERFNSKAYIEVLIRFKNKLVLIKKVNFTKYSGTNPYTNINYKGIIDLKNINDSNFAMDKNPYIVYSIRVIKIITCPFAGVNDPCEKDVLFRDEVPGNLRKIVSLNNNPTSPPTPAPKTKANLKIKSITVKESGSSKSINVYSGQVLTLESGKSYEFKTTIENNGGTTANNVNYQLLFSESHNYTNPKTAVYPVSSNNINSISANSSSSSTEYTTPHL